MVKIHFQQFLQIESVKNRKLLKSEKTSIRCPIAVQMSQHYRKNGIGSILRNKVKVMSGSDRDRSSSHRHRSRSRSRSKFELVC